MTTLAPREAWVLAMKIRSSRNQYEMQDPNDDDRHARARDAAYTTRAFLRIGASAESGAAFA